jgi:hypothetical protein
MHMREEGKALLIPATQRSDVLGDRLQPSALLSAGTGGTRV